jgi:hypothetical protein
MPYHDDDDDAFDSNGLLKDGHSFSVPHRMLDSYQRDVAQHFYPRPKDSTAFPRRRGTFVTAADGGTFGLHRPGFRLPAGDQALRDAADEEIADAYALYDYEISNAWKRRDEWPKSAEDDDAETEARAGAIRNAVLARGHAPGDVEDYLNSCDDDDLFDNDLGEHIAAFESNKNNNNDQVRRRRLDELYRARDAELATAWKHNK